MRRKWGRGFPINFLGEGSSFKPLPRRWGRKSLFPRLGSSPVKTVPRKWGTGRRVSVKGGGSSSSSNSGYAPAKRWATKRQGPKMKRKHVWLIVVLLLIFAVIQGMIFLDRELRQPMMFLAKVKVNQLAADAINAAIKAEFARAAESDKMILWRTTDEGKITGFELDYKQQMAITAKTIEVVERTLKQHEDVPERIPIGHALNSPLISSIGPSVAVNFHPASVVKAEVGLQQTEAGINMLLVEVYVRIRTEVAVVIPFDREPEIVETKIPLSYALVVGEVPSYYYDGSGNPVGSGASQAPAIALPPPDATIAPSTHTP
ncbi:sporulation protein YunB [Cohnella phaseoli]|uniref:Sporulation protein YunB n=1 Tax=Cohnella phaseoli TaxID=456490 RepID=A0A3D9JMW5_9BACL|nr:sporulation protein YunB [Cohnella phaseoli]RED75412.1 sporulation protein YunB [Cohnella phaseoli]